MAQYRGASRQHEVSNQRRRKDTRPAGQRFREFFQSADGAVMGTFLLPIISLAALKVPFSGECLLLLAWAFNRRYVLVHKRAFDFPYRVPKLANVNDGSYKGLKKGEGVTLFGNDLETKEQIYAGDSDLRTHQLVLGTTGSGKTELLLGIVFNALVQNTGFIYVDGKGDPKLQKEIFRLARYLGREDDLLIINFITSGRDFFEKQVDKVTNNMNMMGNTSSGMLIELIVSLMDDSGGGGDMWKGRAIMFIAALTRPLTYLRDKGYINLSPEKYLEYFELNIIEELVWEHNGKYGDQFDIIVAPLRSYLLTLPGYAKAKFKKQETKTLEQHGYIVMQLGRIFNDLTFNYGHIFKTRVGDVDFYDVVINRRLLVVLLPALERAPDSLRMLGKMIVGSIKQMMAGCLGNRVEGVVREIIDSRPTGSKFPFYTILDEYGYYAVVGFAVAPAQARSLGFSVTFAAQDFSSLKKSSAEEADATWENTNIRAIGRLTSGTESETWRRVQGAAAEAAQAMLGSFERTSGGASEGFRPSDNITIEQRNRLNYDDVAMQENGEFTFLIGKKSQGGKTGGVALIRGLGFYTAGPTPKEMRINDFIPVEAPEPADLPQNKQSRKAFVDSLKGGSFCKQIKAAIKGDPILTSMHSLFERNYANPDRPILGRQELTFAVLGKYLSGDLRVPASLGKAGTGGEAGVVTPSPAIPATAPSAKAAVTPRAPEISSAAKQLDESLKQAAIEKSLLAVADLFAQTKPVPAYESATPLKIADDDDEIFIAAETVTTNIVASGKAGKTFRDKALPLLRQHLYMLDDDKSDDAWEDELEIAERGQMLDMEVMASGKPFESLSKKWAAEDRIRDAQAAIARETTYILPPEPEPVELADMRNQLADLNQICGDVLKGSLRD